MIRAGERYFAKNQGTCITPFSVPVVVVWNDGVDIHYRMEDSVLVKQTPIARFCEIVGVDLASAVRA